uniref:C-C motif chemokine n=1 Tax=Scophthalmus maximus TaxID=52904 RepID=A0A8D2ZRB4_SCOMX
MRFSLALPTLLCFLTWMNSVHTSQGPGYSCCLRWATTRIPLTQIRNYTIQSEVMCPITAVVFLTTRGKRICSDPNSKWAKRAIVAMEQNEQRSTSDITPTVSTTSKKVPGKKGRRERRRQRNKSRRGRRGRESFIYYYVNY